MSERGKNSSPFDLRPVDLTVLLPSEYSKRRLDAPGPDLPRVHENTVCFSLQSLQQDAKKSCASIVEYTDYTITVLFDLWNTIPFRWGSKFPHFIFASAALIISEQNEVAEKL